MGTLEVFYDHQVYQIQRRGGISRYFSSLVGALEQASEFRAVIGPGIHDSDSLPVASSRVSIRGTTFRLATVPHTYRARCLVNQLITLWNVKRVEPSVWHPTYYWTPPWRVECPIALTVYDLIHEKCSTLMSRRDPTIKLRQRSVKAASIIFAISEATKRDLIELYEIPEEKVWVTYLANGLQVKPVVSEVRSKPYLLFVGPRYTYKNFQLLVRMFEVWPDFARRFDVVCVGGGKPRDVELTLGSHFVFLPEVTDESLASLYQGAFALVYPSRYEGFGLPVLEAMYYSCPVVTSRCGSLPEVGGNAASYVDIDDPDSLRTVVEELHSRELRRSKVLAGLEQERKFSWERCASRTLEGYRSIAR